MRYALRERISVEVDLQNLRRENAALIGMANQQKDLAEDFEKDSKTLKAIVQSMALK
jgi:hypothetical protein